MAQKPIEVFFSYSRGDKPLRDELEQHLSSLKRRGVITSWHDRQIMAGAEWKDEIDHHIQTADVILLLISPAFVYSDYCYDIELPAAMARHDRGEAIVVPILLRPVEGWEDLPFAKLQVYPSGGKPVTDWENRDRAYFDIAKGIREAVEHLQEKRQQQEQDLIQWLGHRALPLSNEDWEEVRRRQKRAGLTDADVQSRIEMIVAVRVQAAQLALQAAQAAEQRQREEQAEQERRAAEQRQREAEAQREAAQRAEAQRQAEAAEQAQRLEAERQAKIRAEKARQEQAEQARRNSHQPFTIALNKKGLFGKSIPLDMIAIPDGKFWMGSPNRVDYDNERPRHKVTIAPFFMGKYPITQAQYQAVMGKNPSRFKGENRPVECVSWHDAIAFCQQLSKMSGRSFRLPSEAEWEYACRSGTETQFYFGETISAEQVYHNQDYSKGTSEVGKFLPNQFGLYDMHGNVWEWCADHWHGSYEGAPIDGSAWIADEDTRLLRGGSWYNAPDYCRSAFRNHYSPDDQYRYFGFRVVCV
jgi:formylglycine-generating enzyme required for sulfatase activity